MSNGRFTLNLNRRNTTAGPLEEEDGTPSSGSGRQKSSQVVCQRCKRFEVDLTNASDNLSATDAELKASRQVISLLQRQLELFQVEKEGLERLIVSQSTQYVGSPSGNAPPCTGDTEHSDMPESDLKLDLQELDSNFNGDIQKRLLSLIKTQLYSKDEEIVRLKSNLKEVQNEKEQLNVQVHLLEDDLNKLKVESSMLRENLALRDQTIVSLSNEVFEQTGGDLLPNAASRNNRRQSSAETLLNHTANHFRQASSEHKYQREISKLSESLEAYKKTNELLGQNVLNLTDRCAQTEKREMEAKSQAQELEARCCQIQSKLLSLLKEIEQSTSKLTPDKDGQETVQQESKEFIHSEPVKLLIKRLLEDKSLDIPLSWKEGNKSKVKTMGERLGGPRAELDCDELGFYIVPGNDRNSPPDGNSSNSSSPMGPTAQTRRNRLLKRGMSEGGPLLGALEEAIETVEDVQHRTVDSAKDDQIRWRCGWDEFIKDFDQVDLDKSKEFKALLRSGVPQEYRCKIWKALIDLKVGKERQSYGPNYYQNLLEPPNIKSMSHSSKQQISQSSKQIELDLLRTLPNNKYFETIDSPGTVRLRRILNAFACHKQEIGYCQGMNRLAAVALLVLPEEEAFWCLVLIVEKIMPSGYYNDLWLTQVDSNVVMDFVGQLMPLLAEHFRRHEIELSLFAWFLTIFVDGTQPAFFLRLWDCFLYEGDKILFRIALALLKRNESTLLDLRSSVSVNNHLRSKVNGPMDIDGIFKVAFETINPLPKSRVRSRRELHFQTMKISMRDHSLPQSS